MSETIIVVSRRFADYHACIKGRPEFWGCGHSSESAIGNLILSHAEQFAVTVDFSAVRA
jgi:hypothetical protein